jgi:hypothetical protein
MEFRIRGAELLAVAGVALAAAEWTDEWIAAYALVVLWLGFRLLFTTDRIPVLFAAFAYQWMQTSIGVFYSAFTGHVLKAQVETDFRRMMLLGLTALLALAVGLRLGIALIRDEQEHREERPLTMLTWRGLMLTYVASIVLEGTVLSMVLDYPTLRQILVTITAARLGVLFLVLRRVSQPVFRAQMFAAVLLFEVGLGLTGYFAGFREPIVIGAIVLAQVFDTRKPAHWATAAVVVAMGSLLAVMWMGVRSQYRAAMDEMDPMLQTSGGRVTRVQSLGAEFFSTGASQFQDTTDKLIDRMWAVYYPGLALPRVPAVIPHTGGAFLTEALVAMVTPRVIFTGKAPLVSDSEKVRKYSGTFVAGAEVGTTIAFGYVIESYIDFGTPGMFVPIFVFGLAMGAVYAWFLRVMWHRELAAAVVLVVYWISLFLFERSWASLLGNSASLILYLGVPVVLLDRFLSRRGRRKEVRAFGSTYSHLSEADSR